MSIELQRALEGTPDHWRTLKVKHIAKRFYGGGTPDSGNKDYYSDSGTSWMMISDLTRSPFVSSTRKHLSRAGIDSKGLRILPAGCIVYSMYASVGAVATLHIESAINQAIIGIEVRKDSILGRFLHLYLEAVRPIVYAASNASTQANLNAAKVKNFPVPTPPLEEQRLIVRYLDNAELRIAKAIQAKQRMAKLLMERREVVASTLLFGSIPTGDTWYGEVPADWELLPGRALFQERIERQQSALPMLSVTIRHGVIPQAEYLASSVKRDQSNSDRSAYKVTRPGDIVYNKMRAWQGAAGLSAYHGIVSPAYVVQTPRESMNAKYAALLMRSARFAKEAERLSYGITSDMWSLRPQHFKQIMFPVPAKSVQEFIVEAVEARAAGIQAALTSIEQEISLLREYRTKLISDVVTGKKDVRAEAATMKDVDPAELAAVLAGTATGGNDEVEGDDDAE